MSQEDVVRFNGYVARSYDLSRLRLFFIIDININIYLIRPGAHDEWLTHYQHACITAVFWPFVSRVLSPIIAVCRLIYIIPT